MADDQSSTDYYGVLQVSPDCDAEVLESAYRYLAKKYHPDRSGTADTYKFNEVIQAYRALRHPKQRAQYNRKHFNGNRQEAAERRSSVQADSDEQFALNDAEDHIKILMLLYKARREQAKNAGVVAFYIQEMLNCSDDRFEFHQWYLKEKGFIAVTEHGTLAITVHGVDYVISLSRDTSAEKLMISQSSNAEA